MLSIALARRLPPSFHLPARVGWLIPLGFLALGCPSGAELENADDWAETDCDPTPIFEASCSGNICHSPDDDGTPPSGGTDLTSPGVAARLYNQPPLAGECATSGALLINSADPASSLMLLKVHDEQSCGDGMPVPYSDASKLPDTDLACIENWVNRIAADGPGDASGTGGSGTGGGASGDGLGTGGGT